MTYASDIGDGQRLLVENDGDHTQVALNSGDAGQKESQSSGFDTGTWSNTPELFRTSQNLVLKVESKTGVTFIGIHGRRMELIHDKPDIKDAEKLTLKESNEKIPQMKPMEPMKPMAPMKPMKPMN